MRKREQYGSRECRSVIDRSTESKEMTDAYDVKFILQY